MVVVKGLLLRCIAYAHLLLLSIEDGIPHLHFTLEGLCVEKINIRSFMETKKGDTRQWGSDHYREVS